MVPLRSSPCGSSMCSSTVERLTVTRAELTATLKSAGLTVCAQQECACIPGIAPQSPVVCLQQSRSAAVMSSAGIRHAITGSATSRTNPANNPSLCAASFIGSKYRLVRAKKTIELDEA